MMERIDRRFLIAGAGLAGAAAALPADLLAQTQSSGNAVSAQSAL